MRILITGGRGFIGTAVKAALLEAGHAVRPFDRRDGYDIMDRTVLMGAVDGMDTVIHLAGVLGTAELFDNPQLAIDVNVTGTLNVLDACVQGGASYVGITMPQVFPSIYTATKVCATRLASAYHHTHGLPVCHVRAFNAFGPGQAHGPGHPRKIIPALSVAAWSGAPLIIWGDGEQTVDLISTRELADIFVEAIHVGDDSTIDGGTKVKWTVNEVARFIQQETGWQSGIEHHPMRRGEIPTKLVATEEGWDHLNFRPQLFLGELVETIHSYKDHPLVTK